MIDYLIVIYKNYELLDLQVNNFKKRFPSKDYKLVVIDNTPNDEKKAIPIDPIIDKFIPIDSFPTFDGISHGNAIDIGLTYCDSDIVGITDSDYFILNNNIHSYVYDKFDQGYLAVGTEYNDGEDTSFWVNICPSNFQNIPCCFGSYYDRNLAKTKSWTVTPDEVEQNRSTGFVEVGWKIRKYILENNVKTFNWKTKNNNYGACYFENECGDLMGFHYVAGSHRRWNPASRIELEKIIEM